MEEATLFINRIPVYYDPFLELNSIAILYKSEGKTSEEIIQMKKDKNQKDFDKIFYNLKNIHVNELFKYISKKISK